MRLRFSTAGMARACARHPWTVVGAWVVATAVLVGAAFSLGPVFTSEMEFTSDVEGQVARDLLERMRGPEPLFEQVVVQSEALTVDDAAFEAFVADLAADLRGLDGHVESVLTYYDLPVPLLVSADRHTTLVQTKLVGDIDTAAEPVDALLEVLRARDGKDGFTVVTAGLGSMNHTWEVIAQQDLEAETRALPFAMVILLLVFGAVVAALIPLLVAAVAIVVATALAILLSNLFPLSIFVTNMILMFGLALGIDYALFIVERFREERRYGREKIEAITIAGETASRAVLFSGATVVISLLGMMIVPSNIFRAMGAGAIIAAAAAVLVGLTLLPALLSLVGDGVNRLAIPFFSRRGTADEDRGFWAGAARLVMRHPVAGVVLATVLLVAFALPYLRIELGFAGPGSLPENTDAHRAFAILNEEFSAGQSLATEIVVEADDASAPEVQEAIGRLRAAVKADPVIRLNPSPTDGLSEDGTVALVTVALPGEYAGEQAQEALHRLRSETIPAAFAGVDARVYVGGMSAVSSDFFDMVDRYTPIVFVFVLSMSFVLLLLVFRSLVVPLKAIVMNLLSVGAAYGLIVLVFQEGVGAGLLGFQTIEVVEAWVPLFLFMILFGLSMDYHVFLLSRIRERYDQTGDNAGSVAHGIRTTANIITGAAAIMIVVFGGFALGDLVMFQQFGFGLAVAVFLDATVVRMVLVPSAMQLLGDVNWYLPSWLAWLPDLRVEAAGTRAPVPAATPGGGDGG